MRAWGRKWTKKETLLVQQWQEKGIAGKEQAVRLNRSYASWKNAITRYGLERHKHGDRYSNYRPELRLATIKLLQQGMKLCEIAKVIGIAPSMVSKIVGEFVGRGVVVRLGKNKGYKITEEWR